MLLKPILNLAFVTNLSKRTKTSGALSTIYAMAMKTELRAMKNQPVTTHFQGTQKELEISHQKMY